MADKSWRDMSAAQATVLAALIGIIPAATSGLVSGFFTYTSSVAALKDEIYPVERTRKRIDARLSPRAGYTKHVYPNLGIGLRAPAQWTTEDAAAKFAGGELDLVKRYEDTKGIIGIKFRYRSVQKNYINDIQAEIENQRDVWEKIDPDVVVEDTTIGGRPAKMWKYNQSTGERTGDIRWYWLRLIPQIKLEVICFIYTDSPDREEFWDQVGEIMASLVIDESYIDQRRSMLESSP